MFVRKLMCLATPVCVVLLGALGAGQSPALAADAAKPTDAKTAEAAVTDATAADAAATSAKPLEWKDYKVKGYSLSLYGGSFSGATYLDLMEISDRTFYSADAGQIIAYDGSGALAESINMWSPDPAQRKYNAPRKEIEPGKAIGGRIGIYVADDFHLDLVGNYMSGRAVTTMLYNPDKTNPENVWTRVEVDEDTGFRAYKGGLSLMYDARPATFFGITPQLGFGLGGVINRYTELEDKTALYLEGNFGLAYQALENLKVIARSDLAIFAYEVDELGYSNMVSYKNFTIGAAWFIDTVPADVRAKHVADRSKKSRLR